MSQRDFLRAFDASAFAAFRDAGVADDALYMPPGGGAAVPCVVLVDRGLREFGDDGASVATRYVRIEFQLAEVQPTRGGKVIVDGETFVLDADEDKDESASRWVVVRG